MQSQQQYEIEQILAAKFCKLQKKSYYLIKWFNWYVEDSTWQPEQNLKNAPQIVQEFLEKQNKNQANFDWKKYQKLSQFWRNRKQKLAKQKKCPKHKKIKKERPRKNNVKPINRKKNNRQIKQQSNDVNASSTFNKKMDSSNVMVEDQYEAHVNKLILNKQIVALEENEALKTRKAVVIQRLKNQISNKKIQMYKKTFIVQKQPQNHLENQMENLKVAFAISENKKQKREQIRKKQTNKISAVIKKVGKRNVLEILQKSQNTNVKQRMIIDQANRTRQTNNIDQNSKQINMESINAKHYPKNYIILNQENQQLKQLQMQQLKQKNKNQKGRNRYITSGMNVKKQIKVNENQNKSNASKDEKNSSYISVRQQESWVTPLNNNQESELRVVHKSEKEMYSLPDLPSNYQEHDYHLDQNELEEQQPPCRQSQVPIQDQQQMSMNLSVSKNHIIEYSNNYQNIYSGDADSIFNPNQVGNPNTVEDENKQKNQKQIIIHGQKSKGSTANSNKNALQSQQTMSKAKEGPKLTEKQILKMQLERYKEELDRNSNMGLNSTYYIYDTKSKSQSCRNYQLQKKCSIIQPNIHHIVQLPQSMPQQTSINKQTDNRTRKLGINSNLQVKKGKDFKKRKTKNIDVNTETNILNRDKIRILGLKRFASNSNNDNKNQIKYYIHNTQTGIKSWLPQKQAYQTCPVQIIKFYENKIVYSQPPGSLSNISQHQ